MRFVPHRNVSFQHSLDDIDSDYDSVYSSDSSLEVSDSEEKNTSIVTENALLDPYTSTELVVTKLNDILEDLQIQERFLAVSEASALMGQTSIQATSNEKYYSSMEKAKNLLRTEKIKECEVKPETLQDAKLIDEQNIIESLGQQYAKQDIEVEAIIKQMEEERRRVEEERIRQEEEARRKAEEEKRRKEEEERRLKEEEEERERLAKLEQERIAKEAEEARKKKEIEDARSKREKELKKAEEEKLKAEEERKLKLNAIGTHSNLKIQREFLKYKQDIADIKKNIVEPLQANKELKQATNKVRRKINPKFGQLTDSRGKLLQISNEILLLVNESRSLHELSYHFILNYIAKELIKQAEVEVIVNPQHSVPLGGLTLNLLQVLPDLKYYLLARFYKKCPFLIGFTCAIDTEEGRERMGWRRSNNKWEEESKYNERVGGIATLYSVISRLNIGNGSTDNAIPISKSWIFLSRMLNTEAELLADVHYILVANWWDACCKEFLQTYGIQGSKLLKAVSFDWLKLVEAKKFSGYVRLRLVAEEWLNEGRINSFKDMAY